MGTLAAEQVLQQITTGVLPAVQQITVSPGFVVRESTCRAVSGSGD
jgi:DNA-binding LacI/PurR family transcriptional regulator